MTVRVRLLTFGLVALLGALVLAPSAAWGSDAKAGIHQGTSVRYGSLPAGPLWIKSGGLRTYR